MTRDPWQVPMAFSREHDQLPKGHRRHAYDYAIHPGILANLDRAASMLEAAGYEVEEIETPSMAEAPAVVTQHQRMKRLLEPVLKPMVLTPSIRYSKDIISFRAWWCAEGYLLGIAARTALVREWNLLLREYPLLLTPYLMRPGYPCDHDETFEGVKDLSDSIYSYGVNYIGMPAGFVPVDLVDGLPSGIQLIVKNGEDLILDAMQVIEDAAGVMTQKALGARNGR